MYYFDNIECDNIELNEYHGTIQNPGFGQNVFESYNCRWRIRTSEGSRIRLIVHSFVMEEKKSNQKQCQTNFFEVSFLVISIRILMVIKLSLKKNFLVEKNSNFGIVR